MKLSSLEAIFRVFNDAEVRYLIAGGLAVAAHGYGRVTFDVDMVVQLNTPNVQRALEALASIGYGPTIPVPVYDFADPVKRDRWIREKGMVDYQLHSDQHAENRIDLFVNEPFDFEKEFSVATTGQVTPGLSVRFVSVGTLIKMKKVAGREKDKDDIKQLQRLSKDLSDE